MTGLTQEEFAAWKASEERTRQRNGVIIRQYIECTRALNDLFRHAPDDCYLSDGVGCCDIDRALSEDGLAGPAWIPLIEMRDARLEEEHEKDPESMKYHRACPYHKRDAGCILGELKSPRCIADYCSSAVETIGYDYGYIRKMLDRILYGEVDYQTGEFHPERNWPLVAEFKVYVSRLAGNLELMQQRAG